MSPDRAAAPASSVTTHVGLLTEIMSNTLDQDYQVVADGRTADVHRRPPPRRFIAAVVVLLFGAMIGISALRTQQQKPAAAAERDQLVAQIHVREDRLNTLHTQLSALDTAVASLQTAAGASKTLQRQTEAALVETAGITGATAVSGPGLEIITDNAADSVGSADGVILDADLQSLVNALWTAGAEAISINGQRLTSLTAIRFAGQAITVDYRSLTPPYVIDAIGDSDTLPARLLETPGGQAWLGLKANFGITFDTETKANLVLPGDVSTDLRQASPVVSR